MPSFLKVYTAFKHVLFESRILRNLNPQENFERKYSCCSTKTYLIFIAQNVLLTDFVDIEFFVVVGTMCRKSHVPKMYLKYTHSVLLCTTKKKPSCGHFYYIFFFLSVLQILIVFCIQWKIY